MITSCSNGNDDTSNTDDDYREPVLNPTETYSVTTDSINTVLSSITNTSGLYQLTIDEDIPNVQTITHTLNNYSEIFVILDFSKTKLETINFYSFSNPTVKKIILPDTLVTIGEDAFYGCTNLVSINIPDSVTTIKGSAFQDCSELKQIKIGKNVKSLGEQAFTSCVNLKTIKWGDKLETIGMRAFSSCNSLESVVIPDSVKTINSYAFRNCDSLKSVTIGKNVDYLHWEIFIRCPSLTSITFTDCNNWYRINTNDTFAGGTKTDLSNPSQNAKYFTQTYSSWYWYKK